MIGLGSFIVQGLVLSFGVYISSLFTVPKSGRGKLAHTDQSYERRHSIARK